MRQLRLIWHLREGKGGRSLGLQTIYRKMGKCKCLVNTFAVLCRDHGTQGLWWNRPCWVSRSQPHLAYIPCKPALVRALFLGQHPHPCLNCSRPLRGRRQKLFLSLLFLEKKQPKRILVPKRHIFQWQTLLPSFPERPRWQINSDLSPALLQEAQWAWVAYFGWRLCKSLFSSPEWSSVIAHHQI